MTIETMIGPMVVPNEFKPPAKLSLCAPVSGLPNNETKGFAEVC